MNTGKQPQNSSRIGNILLWVYLAVFTISLLCLLFGSKENEGLKDLARILVYGTGLPLIVTSSLYYAAMKGWLVLGKKNEN